MQEHSYVGEESKDKKCSVVVMLWGLLPLILCMLDKMHGGVQVSAVVGRSFSCWRLLGIATVFLIPSTSLAKLTEKLHTSLGLYLISPYKLNGNKSAESAKLKSHHAIPPLCN